MFAMTGGYSGLPLEDTDGTWAEPPPPVGPCPTPRSLVPRAEHFPS